MALNLEHLLTPIQEIVEVLVARNGTVSELLAALQKKANLDDEVIREMRFFDVLGGKIRQEFRDDFSVTNIPEYSTIYAEKIPTEELHMDSDDRVINAFNFNGEPSRTHGIPFKFVVKPVSVAHLRSMVALR